MDQSLIPLFLHPQICLPPLLTNPRGRTLSRDAVGRPPPPEAGPPSPRPRQPRSPGWGFCTEAGIKERQFLGTNYMYECPTACGTNLNGVLVFRNTNGSKIVKSKSFINRYGGDFYTILLVCY